MQYLWQYQIDWDEELPDPIRSSWQEFHAQLSALNNIKIPRQKQVCSFQNQISSKPRMKSVPRKLGTFEINFKVKIAGFVRGNYTRFVTNKITA
ncbi:Pao retrotransposon peptidase [Popillia japonica]|uniref:Pao retrotransposon peptidase n=1 Tax=Popillia japonica TaxID=7064 RepID=A0AAW1K1D4_POPJA